MAWGFTYSLTVHGPDEFYDVEKFYLRQKVEQAKFILCISNFCRSQLMRIAAPEHWDKMRVVRLGVDLNVFLPMPPGLEPDLGLEILCVGRLVPSKGQLILLRACAILLSRGREIRVRMVGDGPDLQHLQSFAEQEVFRRSSKEQRATTRRASFWDARTSSPWPVLPRVFQLR